MKTCKSCIKEIDNAASKCPYCQSFQIWYKNPQIFGFIFPLVFIPVMFYSMGIWFNKNYPGNEHLFEVKEIGISPGEHNRLALNYLIANKSDTKWHNISYEVSVFDAAGKLLFVKTGQDYSWLVQPNQSSYLTIELDNNLKAEKWKLKILDIKSGRF
ncbi:MAG: hypothetical protein KJ556_12015 [Gammaproteobacteria bacterium]|nr:hypothetical protein [Gammaproteobacteria bacterium]MBU2059900.1 hypothetical protein [Gammaproteobacteria bacterium]MBU2175845.1 hypothetical protein [Gammaproteobacteria bacterium]MBU2247668.1 hypothetical protein [Gammaproteobacteria bacterium]MBU2346473.1 hypothetical protein [Gammaproteobacteria bacterium]